LDEIFIAEREILDSVGPSVPISVISSFPRVYNIPPIGFFCTVIVAKFNIEQFIIIAHQRDGVADLGLVEQRKLGGQSIFIFDH